MRLALVVLAVAAGVARADDLEPIPDIIVHRDVLPRRIVADVDLVPLVTDLGMLTIDLLVAPFDHHALRVAPFAAWGSTAPIFQLPEETVRAYGLELGYRYYSGLGGPRGWYIGPSLIAAAVAAHGSSSRTDYDELGIALDTGYAATVADRVAIALGVGVEALDAAKTLPVQQFPSEMFAARGVWPRVSLAIGWAF